MIRTPTRTPSDKNYARARAREDLKYDLRTRCARDPDTILIPIRVRGVAYE